MKKFLAIALSAVLALSLAACKPADPKAAYAMALEKSSALSSMQYQGTAKIGMNLGGMSMDLNMSIDVKAINDEKDPKVFSGINMNLMGTDVKVETAYLDGYCYLNVMNQKAKCKLDYKEFVKNSNSMDLFPTLTADELIDVKAEKSGDSTVYSFSVPESALKSFTEALLSSGAVAGATASTNDVQLQNINCVVTIDKNGYIANQKITMDCSMTIEEQALATTVELDMTLVDPGKEVTIEVTDPDSYEEVDAADLGL